MQIENYDNMTPEEKLEAVTKYAEGLEKSNADLTKEVTNVKTTASNKASEVARFKKMYEEKLSESEKAELARQEAEAQRAEADKAKDARIAELEKAANLSNYTKQYMAAGYDSDTSEAMAKALTEGDMQKVFEITKAHNDKQAQALAEAKLNKQPDPSAGSVPTGKTPEEEYKEKLYRAAGLK